MFWEGRELQIKGYIALFRGSLWRIFESLKMDFIRQEIHIGDGCQLIVFIIRLNGKVNLRKEHLYRRYKVYIDQKL